MLGKNMKIERIKRFLGQIKQNQSASIGLFILVVILLTSLFAPVIAPHEPTETNPTERFAGPSAEHPFGTDDLGRDTLTRTLYGGQTSLFMGFASIALALLFGVPMGIFAGYSGGKSDETIMRGLDVLMSFPTLILALLVLTALGSSAVNAIIAIGVVYTPRIARVVRANTLSVKNEEYIEAAISRGESTRYILSKEILPNVGGPIIVEASIRIGYAITIAATLSFLGLGAQPPTADWGLMISEARDNIYSSPWVLLFPSLFLGATVLALNLLGDGLGDILDPQNRSH